MNPTTWVFRKEARELFRDKRVRSSAIVMPGLILFALLYMLGSVIGSLAKTEGQTIHVVGKNSDIAKSFQALKFKVETVDSPEAGKKLIRDGKARVVLQETQGPQAGTKTITVFLDGKEQRSQILFSQLEGALAQAQRPHGDQVLQSKGLTRLDLEPVQLKKEEVVVGEKGGASEMIVGMLPYTLVIWAFFGGIGIASDLVAGEKEKNTLETLLVTPVSRTRIVLGKVYALSMVCLMSSLSAVLGLVLYAVIKPPGSELMLKGGLGITATSVSVMLLTLIPAVALFGGLMVAISSFAKNTREAQTHLGLVSFIVLMPAIASQFIGLTEFGTSKALNFIPVLNTSNTIRLALLGKTDWASVGMTVAVSLVLAALATWVAIKLFNRENVLTRV